MLQDIVFLNSSRSALSTSARKPLVTMPAQFLEVVIMRADGIDGAASIQFPGYDRIIPGAMVNIDNAGHNSLGDIGPAEDLASLVEDIDHIPVLDAPLRGIDGMNPDRFIEIAVRALNFAGLDFMEPVDIIELGMDSPSGMVGDHQQRIFFGSLAGNPFIMEVALFNPVGYRWSLLIIREVLGQSLGIEFQLAGGGGQGIFLRVFVELDHAGRDFLPVGIGGDHVVFLFLQFVPRCTYPLSLRLSRQNQS